MPKLIDLTGMIFNNLEVISFHHTDNIDRFYLCRCKCGNELVIRGRCVRHNHTRSCGCIRGLGQTRHGHTVNGRSKTYRAWQSMTSRCQQESNVEYWRYGGSGIKICNKWQKFDGFLDDMGKSPDGGTLDRIDGTKGYNKANCRWATTLQQAVNRRGNLNSTSKYKGVYMPTNRKNWCARIQSKDKAFNLGTFTDEKEAALAYNKAAYDLWGKDAYLNKFD